MVLAVVLAASARAQTVLSVVSEKTVRLRVGQTVEATLTDPGYVGMRCVLPARARLVGRVVALEKDEKRRNRGRWNLDFTPWSRAVVQFDEARLPDGRSLTMSTEPATGAAAAVTVVAGTGKGQGNFVSRQVRAVASTAVSTVTFFTAKGRGDRVRDLVLHQLPWHPQWVNAGTAWQVRSSGSLTGGAEVANLDETSDVPVSLDTALSSATARTGEAISATVQRPVRVRGKVWLQGTKLRGKVTEAHAAGALGRAGLLRFAFDTVQMADGSTERLDGQIQAARVAGAERVAIDEEGTVRPVTEDRFVVPAVLLVLAASPLTPDPGDNDEFVKNAGASNGLGVVGFAIGVGLNDSNVAAGLGFYSAAVSTGYRWLAHGNDVTFARDTRLVVHVQEAR